ncbi:energy-coupling factor transporter transmembrane protein EcfT [bacterium]|nr:energy-coupling factor transporter transmembrane protein EcfT [bacterium]
MELKRQITLGQYVPGKSILHTLDPRIKLLSSLILMVVVFLIHSVTGYLVMLGVLMILVFLSRIPVRYFINGLKPILMLLVLTVSLQVFFTKGTSEPLFQWWIVKVYQEGLVAAVFILLRLVLLVFSSSLLTLTTSPMRLTSAIEFILKPFSYLGLPTSEISMMMTIALRFIPTILEETDRLIKAQSSRGAEFETGNLFKRLQGLIPILVPLFISSFRRADDLAIAMESRCFQVGIKRTQMHPLVFRSVDFLSFGLFLTILLLIVLFF